MLKQAFTFLITTRGIPMIYYGDEIGMTGGDDPDNRRDFPTAAFAAPGRTPAQQDVFEHVRNLLQLRAASPALRQGKLVNLVVDDDVYAFARVTPNSRVVVVFNRGSSSKLRIPLEAAGGSTPLEIELRPGSAAIYP